MLVVAAMACFSALDTVSKFIGASVSVVLVMGVRFLIQVVVTGGLLLPRRGRSLFRTRHPVLQFVRGVLLLLSSTLAFLSLRHIPLSEFSAILMLTPLVITVVAAAALGERVSPLRWVLVAGGFTGALIVIRPGSADFTWYTLLPLSVVAVSTVFQLLTSRLAQVDDAGTMHFYTGCVGAALAGLLLPFAWAAPDSVSLWLLILLLGLLGALGHYLLILGYGRASASTLTPFLYTQVAFAALAGWLVFAQTPDRWSVIGIVLIAACGIAATRLTARDAAGKSRGAPHCIPAVAPAQSGDAAAARGAAGRSPPHRESR